MRPDAGKPGAFLVMNEFRPFLRILGTYDAANYHAEHWWPDLVANVLHVARVSALLVALPMQMVLGYWFCVDYDYGMDKVSRAFPINLCILQTILSGGSLASKCAPMRHTIDRLQKIVERGKWRDLFMDFYVISGCDGNLFIDFYISSGCSGNLVARGSQ